MQILYFQQKEDRARYQAIFEEAAAHKKLVVFCGSMISSYAPSDLPEGGRVTKTLLRRLFSDAEPITAELRELLEQTAFEHVLEHHPGHGNIRASIASNYAVTHFNPVHARIAELVASGALAHIVTTNYDDGIEMALRAAGVTRFNIVASEADAVDPLLPTLFKTHGCITKPGSLAFALRQEYFEKWKSELLHQLCADATLLVVGYSGVDIDVCPQLFDLRMRVRHLIWLFYSCDGTDKELTPTAKLVMQGSDGGSFAIGGDLKLALDLSGRLLRSCHFNQPARDARLEAVVNGLMTGLSDIECRQWRAALLVGLACPTLAYREATELLLALRAETGSVDPRELRLRIASALRLRGHAEYELGRYRTAIETFCEAKHLLAGATDLEPQTAAEAVEHVNLDQEELNARTSYGDSAGAIEIIRASLGSVRKALPLVYGADVTLPKDLRNLLLPDNPLEGSPRGDIEVEFEMAQGKLAFHILLHAQDLYRRGARSEDPELFEMGKDDSWWTLAKATRSRLYAAGVWRTAQYLEARFAERDRVAANRPGPHGGHFDQLYREFHPLNDVIAHCMFSWREADRLLAAKAPLEEGIYSQISAKLHGCVGKAMMIGAQAVIWKLRYRLLCLQLNQLGFSLYGPTGSTPITISSEVRSVLLQNVNSVLSAFELCEYHDTSRRQQLEMCFGRAACVMTVS